jgi:hypothetical protein
VGEMDEAEFAAYAASQGQDGRVGG